MENQKVKKKTIIPDELSLCIAGFNINLCFGKTDWQIPRENYRNVKETLKIKLHSMLKGMVLNKSRVDFDYKIHFVGKKGGEIITRKKDGKSFISFFRKKSTNIIESYYHISLIQFQLLLRNILIELLELKGGFLLHASASKVGPKAACVFLGKKASGKSTIIELLNQKFPALADDTIIIRKENNKFYLYQTPFIEKEWWIEKKSDMYDLSCVFLLKKSSFLKEKKVNNKELVIDKIITQCWAGSKNQHGFTKYLLDFAAQYNKFYLLHFVNNKTSLIKFFKKRMERMI